MRRWWRVKAVDSQPRYGHDPDECGICDHAQDLMVTSPIPPHRKVVHCDAGCAAFVEPYTEQELRAALEHWKNHSRSHGCSHGR